jgi:hypothetical protein
MLLHLMHDWAVRREPWQVPRPNPPTLSAPPALTQPRAGYAWRWKAASCLSWRMAAALGRVIVLAAAAGHRTVSR